MSDPQERAGDGRGGEPRRDLAMSVMWAVIHGTTTAVICSVARSHEPPTSQRIHTEATKNVPTNSAARRTSFILSRLVEAGPVATPAATRRR